jgi:hypothetical protein
VLPHRAASAAQDSLEGTAGNGKCAITPGQTPRYAPWCAVLLAAFSNQVLFTVVSREEKYSAKLVIDTVIQRLGDALAAAVFQVLGELIKSCVTQHTLLKLNQSTYICSNEIHGGVHSIQAHGSCWLDADTESCSAFSTQWPLQCPKSL